MLCEFWEEESSATDSVTDVKGCNGCNGCQEEGSSTTDSVTDVRKKEEGRGDGCQLNVKCSTSLLFDDDCPHPLIVGGNRSIILRPLS